MKRARELQVAGIQLNRNGPKPLYRQTYEALRQAILAGRLRRAERLPSTRVLARELGVSRTTLVLAYEDLLAEGYIETRVGSGTYVSPHIPEELLQAQDTVTPRSHNRNDPVPVSSRGQSILEAARYSRAEPSCLRPFEPGQPALREFPFKLWSRLQGQALASLPHKEFGYGDPQGYRELRVQLADYLRTARAVSCHENQVLITSGSQQALDLISRLLADAGDQVWMEDPGYMGARQAFAAARLQIQAVPIDEEGFSLEAARQSPKSPRLVYVSPSHQYPLGVTMSLARRGDLLEHASRVGAWIIEDDYDSEFRYQGSPLSSLQGIDCGQRVLYTGTFSKVLHPGLRLAYVVVPEALVPLFVAGKAASDRGCPIPTQATLSLFMAEGHFGRHIRRMRLLYENRQARLRALVQRHLRGKLRVEASAAGMHVIGWLAANRDDRRIEAAARSRGVLAPALSSYSAAAQLPPGLVLGYAPFSGPQMEAALLELGDILSADPT